MTITFSRSLFQAIKRNPRFTLLMAFNTGVNVWCGYPQIEPYLPAPKLAQPTADCFARSKPLSAYLKPDWAHDTFRQGKVGDCYLLSGFDAIQHHPLGQDLLNRIRVEEVVQAVDESVKTYLVHFPTGETVPVHDWELGAPQGKKRPVRGSTGVQLFELAFAKLISPERNKNPAYAPEPYPDEGQGHVLELVGGGFPADALGTLFMGTDRAKFTHCYDYPYQLRTRLREIAKDTSQEYVLCALTDNKGKGQTHVELPAKADGEERHIKKFHLSHSFSIRTMNPDDTVIVADPHDTAHKVERLTMEEFGQVFKCVSGIRFRTPAKRPQGSKAQNESAE